jgi:AraC-like DNA-binding protein
LRPLRRFETPTKDGSQGPPCRLGSHVRERPSYLPILGQSDIALVAALDILQRLSPTLGIAPRRLPSQVGRECRLDAGSAVLMSCADVGDFVRPRQTRYLTLFVPRRRLSAMAVNPEDALARPIPSDTEALRLLVDYVERALRKQRLTSPELRQLFTIHVQDLIALAVGVTRDTGEAARGRGLRAARLSAIKSDIMGQLDNEGLCVADAAVRRGVTPRYVQMLFEFEGTTLTQYALEQRLARALRMLADPRNQGRTISAIAFEVGFGNLSYFNRTFRRHFGMTPSDARRTIA